MCKHILNTFFWLTVPLNLWETFKVFQKCPLQVVIDYADIVSA